jgi:peptidoglycan/xylan/chitin deacetylase (PgdA/CDA1 family)
MKKLLFALLYSTRVIDLISWFNRKRVPIICYHSVTSDSAPVHHDPYKQHVQLTLFLRHLDHLQQKHNVVSLADYVQARARNRRLPDRSVVLTFDDGFEDFYSVAAPHLTGRKLPATVFIIIDRACGRLVPDGESFLSWNQIRELAAAGIDIGSHSCSHVALPELSPADAKKELADSHRILSNTLGRSQISLSYPFGKASEPISRTAKSVGYICAIGHDGGPNSKLVPTLSA